MKVIDSVLVNEAGPRKLYLSVASPDPSPEAISRFGRRRDRVDRNAPVAPFDFGIPLSWEYYDKENFDELISVVNTRSRLYRALRLLQLANEWVETEDGAAGLSKEREMLAYAASGPRIESEYLTSKVARRIETKKKEIGAFQAR